MSSVSKGRGIRSAKKEGGKETPAARAAGAHSLIDVADPGVAGLLPDAVPGPAVPRVAAPGPARAVPARVDLAGFRVALAGLRAGPDSGLAGSCHLSLMFPAVCR